MFLYILYTLGSKTSENANKSVLNKTISNRFSRIPEEPFSYVSKKVLLLKAACGEERTRSPRARRVQTSLQIRERHRFCAIFKQKKVYRASSIDRSHLAPRILTGGE